MEARRPYQGYPYVDPPVVDAPSISAVDAARWNHLPRRQVEVSREAVVPGRSEDSVVEGAVKRDSDAPVVYIDLPEASGSHVADRRTENRDLEGTQGSSNEPKVDPDAPVLYMDVPEAGGSVTQIREETPQEESEFVQETIFYDPFENRRIDRSKDGSEDRLGSDDGQESSDRSPTSLLRPNVLDLNGASSSAGPSTSFHTPSPIQSLMSKEVGIYCRTDANGYPASPIPASEFPEPPPAYTEIDNASSTSSPVTEQPRSEPRPDEPPRTQVIVRDHISSPLTPIGVPHPDRKYMNCHHCGQRVHSLVIKENGFVTHAAAATCCIFSMLPCVVCVYCTDYLKVTNHYCPNCNKIIGYQLPLLSDKIMNN